MSITYYKWSELPRQALWLIKIYITVCEISVIGLATDCDARGCSWQTTRKSYPVKPFACTMPSKRSNVTDSQSRGWYTGSLRLSSRRNSARRAPSGTMAAPAPGLARARTPSPHANSEVSILVTEASPDAAPPPAAPPTVVRVLVHRESDERPSWSPPVGRDAPPDEAPA